jgi:hypothetical protein
MMLTNLISRGRARHRASIPIEARSTIHTITAVHSRVWIEIGTLNGTQASAAAHGLDAANAKLPAGARGHRRRSHFHPPLYISVCIVNNH